MKTEHRHLLFVMLLTLFSPYSLGVILDGLDTKFISIPVHSLLETSGAIMALIVASMIFLMKQRGLAFDHHHYSSIALIAMGVLDFIHAMMMPGELFVWLHSIAVMVGGLLFMTVWLPVTTQVSRPFYLALPISVAIIAILIGTVSIVQSSWIPLMLVDGQFSQAAIWINAIGGVGFFVAAIRFYLNYIGDQNKDDLIFFGHTLLFGVSGLIFAASALWDPSWWLWHLLRLIAYTITLFFVFELFLKAESQLSKTRAEVHEKTKEFQIYFDTIQSVMVALDRNGNITMINPAGNQTLGYKDGELIGKNWFETCLPQPEGRDEDYPHFLQLFSENQAEHDYYENSIVTRDGSQLHMAWRNAPLIDDLGNVNGILSSGMDITEQKKLTIALEKEKQTADEARLQAMAANQAKSNFLAAMSHEIRTPLNGIIGTIDMLALSEINDNQRQQIQTAKRSAELLLTVIDDILDFSKIEAEKLVLEELPISVETEMESTADNLLQLAQKNNVDFIIFCDPSIPSILSDPNRFKQILFNLTGNAIKFSKDLPDRQGSVYLSIESLTDHEGDQHLCINVKDNGIGMDDDGVSRLFKSFSQGEEDITRRYGGTGLGLVITKKLVEAMNGRISVESTKGKGSLFQVLLPIKPIQQDIDPVISDLSNVDVILFTQQNMPARIIKTYLKSANANCILLTDEKQIIETVNQLHSSPIVIITLDSDAYPRVRALLKQAALKPEILFLKIERGKRRYARKLEDECISFDLNAMHRSRLLNSVAALVGREAPEIDMPHEILKPKEVSPDQEQKKMALIVDDNDINQMVIGQQLTLLGYDFEVADDGLQALEKIRARNSEYDFVLTDCHMPIMDGYELTETIREHEREDQHLPIIAITADALKGTRERCLEAGMNSYITKPIPIEELKTKIQQVLAENE